MYHGEHVPGFPKHPHRGFETITFVKTGMIDHADSLGAAARYGDGDVQWLTAGDGINHAEMFPLLNAPEGEPIRLFSDLVESYPLGSKRAAPHFFYVLGAGCTRGEGSRRKESLKRLSRSSPEPLSRSNHRCRHHASWARAKGNSVGVARIEMQPGATYTLPAGKTGEQIERFTSLRVR